MPVVSYKIVRVYKDARFKPRTLKRGLTLEEAQAHCRDPETSSRTATKKRRNHITLAKGEWFDAYDKE